MQDISKSELSLPHFEITSIDVINKEYSKEEIWHGHMLTDNHRRCTCGSRTHAHMKRKIRLKHISIGIVSITLEVTYEVALCPKCNKIQRQDIPFKEEHRRCTRIFSAMVKYYAGISNMTIKDIAGILCTNRNLVRDIDKQRLKELYGDMPITGDHRFLCIDEFSLHKNHQYATVVMDAETGEVLFIEKGNTMHQAMHFIEKAGKEFMKQVLAVAMDMNAQYCKAFTQLAPKVQIVYDGYHIIASYNERVLTQLRRDEQNRLMEEMKSAKEANDDDLYSELETMYTSMKRSNFLILSNRTTLKAKDEAAKAHNRALYEQYESKGLSIPDWERKWCTANSARLDNLLSLNEGLQFAYVLREMLQNALSCTDTKTMVEGIKKFLRVADRSEFEGIKGICKMIRKRFKGIVAHSIYKISNGPLEGTNNLIKTLRRQAYGYRDEKYFFLKIWDASRRYPKKRNYLPSQQESA